MTMFNANATSLADPPRGKIVAWGANDSGQTNVPAPDTGYIAVTGGGDHSLGLKADGSVVAWGCGAPYNFGQCTVPDPAPELYTAIAAGRWHSLGLKTNHSIVAWGDNSFGQTTNVPTDTDFIAVVAGEWHSLGLKADGSVVGWGDNALGETVTPAPNSDFIAIAAGGDFSLGLKSNHTIVVWGDNGHHLTGAYVPTDTDFTAVAAGWYHGLGLKAGGSIVAWGCFDAPVYDMGQCSVPAPNSNFIAIAAGAQYSMGLKSDGSIVAWGQNTDGETNVPAPNTGYIAIAAGKDHGLALKPNPRFVDLNAAGANNGTSWTNAYTKLQDALAAAQTFDEIWVARGMYKPDRGAGITPGDRSATFQLKNGVALYGGFFSGDSSRDLRDPEHNVTILSGDLNGDDVQVSCTSNSDCTSFGGLCRSDFCIIRNNNTENSYNLVTGSGTNATAVLDGFTVMAANGNGPGPHQNVGGWMYNNTSSPTVTNCTFNGNSVNGDGGGMNNNGSSPAVTNCTFSGNTANGNGGGLYNVGSSPTLTNCTFSGNTSNGGDGGGMVSFSGSPTLINCTFNRNRAGAGGAMYNDGNSSIITNCTFSGNSATSSGGGGMVNGAASPTVTNCVFWSNSDSGGIGESAQIHTDNGTPVVNYSIVENWTGSLGGTGNSGSDPLFVNAYGVDNIPGTEDDDLRLESGSPCIDAGDNTATGLSGVTTDLDGNPRFVEDRLTTNTGNGTPPIVDIGAYEFVRDCNHNGRADDIDLTLGTSHDCNANNIPDECDIAGCSGSPACDDCNLNGVPDSCDIISGSLHDVDPHDGFPDECKSYTGLCVPPSNDWSCGGNWPLGGLLYPDDVASAAGVYVTLYASQNVFLDVDATVPSLRLLNGSTLRVTQIGQGNLSIKSPGNLQIGGDLLVAHDRAISVPGGTVTVVPGGIYEKDPSAVAAAPESTTTTLSSAGVNLLSCVPPCTDLGGIFDLSDFMSASINGDLTIDGTQVVGAICGLAEEGSVAGGHTTPVVRIRNHASVDVLQNLVLLGAVGIVLLPTDPLTTPVTVSGDFDNRSIRPDCFSCRNGGFLLNGTSPQFFEVAGTDVGPVGSVDGAEFVMGAVEVAAASAVTFRNSFDNSGLGQASCKEALYVEKLKLDAGSTITLNNCRIYYTTLEQDPSATVTLVGCGELLSVVRPVAPGVDPTGINKGRAISLVPPATVTAAGGGVSAIRVTLLSLHHVDPPYTGGASTPFTLFEGQSLYVGPPVQYVESASSGTLFYASQLQCAPAYLDWSTVGLLHVMGEAVVPSSTYKVEILGASCAGRETSCSALSAPLQVKTSRWGDVETPYNPPATDPQPDTSDISALVNKFKSALGAPIKARALLAGGNARGTMGPAEISPDMSFTHISLCVDAFKGLPYPYKLGKCAGDASKACITDSDCTAQSVTGPCVLCP